MATRSMGYSAPIPVIDIFAGPGGLGEGFAALQGRNGHPSFEIRLSIEKDRSAHESLRLRAFYRQFTRGGAPGLYYDVLRGSASAAELFARFPMHASIADSEAWRAELGATDHSEVASRIEQA